VDHTVPYPTRQWFDTVWNRGNEEDDKRQQPHSVAPISTTDIVAASSKQRVSVRALHLLLRPRVCLTTRGCVEPLCNAVLGFTHMGLATILDRLTGLAATFATILTMLLSSLTT
jgi:hypothetical protein